MAGAMGGVQIANVPLYYSSHFLFLSCGRFALFDSNKNDPQLLVLTGSRLYGYAIETSDYDYRGVWIPPDSKLISLERFDQYIDPNSDTVIYSIVKFISDLTRGNVQHLECLFAQPVKPSPLQDYLKERLPELLSQRFIKSAMGFALAEFRKAELLKQQIKFKNKDQEDIFNLIQGTFQLEGPDLNKILDILTDALGEDPRSYVSSKKGLGEKRMQQVEKYGYCVKSAAHSIRLLSQAMELVKTNTITFPRPEVEILSNIRNGKTDLPYVQTLFKEMTESLNDKLKTCKLPAKVNMDTANDILRKSITKFGTRDLE